jgi:heavy metal sensor kinase
VAAAEYFDAVLRSFPQFMLEPAGSEWPRNQSGRTGRPKDKEKGFRGKDKGPPPEFDKEGPPDFYDFDGPPPPREGPRQPSGPERRSDSVLDDLVLPPGWEIPTDVHDRPYFVVWLSDGKILKSANWSEHEREPIPEEQMPNSAELRTVGENREAIRMGPRRTRILVGQPVRRELHDSAMFAWRLGAVGLAVVLLGLAGGWVVASRVVKPIAAMSETATAISAADMSRRINTDRIDAEMAGLADSLNGAFDRLAGAFARQSQFTADASHELRTPLAVIRTNAELALNKERSIDEYKAAIKTCLQASRRMSGIVDGLLALARADAGTEVPKREMRLDQLVTEVVESLQPLAKAQNVTVSCEAQPVKFVGDVEGLGRLVNNLVGNAIKYNRPGGSVNVTLHPDKGGIELNVSDTGIGIPEEDLGHIFERFYRVDKARTRTTGGAGLGLAICQSVVDAHGGTIVVQSKNGSGTTFTISLPLKS